MNARLLKKIEQMPLVAILRGVTPEEAVDVAKILVECGFNFLEVTLNSPGWAQSLTLIKEACGTDVVLSAGTVLTPSEVDKVHAAGGQAIVSPNMRADVIRRTKELGMISVPGCFTPTECFAALDAGADILKIFPADILGPSFVKSVSAVLPEGTRLCPTGGVTLSNMGAFMSAGVYAMGMGSALYKPGKRVAEIETSARSFVETYLELDGRDN